MCTAKTNPSGKVYAKFKTPVEKKYINGKQQDVKFCRMNTKDLLIQTIDPEKGMGNPRLWTWTLSLRSQGVKEAFDHDLLLGCFLKPDSVKNELIKLPPKLMKGIEVLASGLKISGEPHEPLIIDADGYVVEGCRRQMAALKLLASGDKRFETVPCMILSPSVSKEDIFALAASIHGGKPKIPWDSIDRGTTAAELRDKFRWTVEEIAQRFTWTLKQTTNYLKTYDLIMECRKDNPMHDNIYNPKYWTSFYKVANNTTLLGMMEDPTSSNYDPTLKKKFHSWILRNKINHCTHVTDLVTILKYPKAVDILNNAGSKKAKQWITVNAEMNPLVKSVEDMAYTLRDIEPKELKRIKTENPNAASQARTCIERLVKYYNDLEPTKQLTVN